MSLILYCELFAHIFIAKFEFHLVISNIDILCLIKNTIYIVDGIRNKKLKNISNSQIENTRMPVFKVNVKWSKELFSGVELNTDEPPLVFKAQLFALSGVQPERQKIMVKGKDRIDKYKGT